MPRAFHMFSIYYLNMEAETELSTGKFHHLKEILLLAEMSRELKYLSQILIVYSPKDPAGFIDEPAKVFLS